MPGPKYVKNFEFPRSAGFTGSADAAEHRVSVTQHTRAAPQRYAKGGRVQHRSLTARERAGIYEEMAPRRKPATPTKPPRRASTVDILRGNVRRQREQELGLAHGGRAYAKGGKVMKVVQAPDPGNALVRRSKPTTQQDAVSGGKTPLRPGMKTGGEVAMHRMPSGKMMRGKTMC